MDNIPIVLDKERHLKWTMGGMEKFQEVTGIDVLSGDADPASFTQKEIIPFLWACLLWEDRTLKLEDVKYMVDISKMMEFIQLIPKVVNAAVPQGNADPNAASLSTG
jgi:hypothetical protein